MGISRLVVDLEYQVSNHLEFRRHFRHSLLDGLNAFPGVEIWSTIERFRQLATTPTGDQRGSAHDARTNAVGGVRHFDLVALGGADMDAVRGRLRGLDSADVARRHTSVVAARALGRLVHRLALFVPARGHPRPPHAFSSAQRLVGARAAGSRHALRYLPRNPHPPPPQGQPRAARGRPRIVFSTRTSGRPSRRPRASYILSTTLWRGGSSSVPRLWLGGFGVTKSRGWRRVNLIMRARS